MRWITGTTAATAACVMATHFCMMLNDDVAGAEMVTVGPEAIADQLLSTLRQLAPMAAPPLRETRRLLTRAGAAFKRDLAVPLQLGQCDEVTSRPMGQVHVQSVAAVTPSAEDHPTTRLQGGEKQSKHGWIASTTDWIHRLTCTAAAPEAVCDESHPVPAKKRGLDSATQVDLPQLPERLNKRPRHDRASGRGHGQDATSSRPWHSASPTLTTCTAPARLNNAGSSVDSARAAAELAEMDDHTPPHPRSAAACAVATADSATSDDATTEDAAACAATDAAVAAEATTAETAAINTYAAKASAAKAATSVAAASKAVSATVV